MGRQWYIEVKNRVAEVKHHIFICDWRDIESDREYGFDNMNLLYEEIYRNSENYELVGNEIYIK